MEVRFSPPNLKRIGYPKNTIYMKTPTKLNKIVFIKNNTLDLIPIAKKIKAEETEKDKII